MENKDKNVSEPGTEEFEKRLTESVNKALTSAFGAELDTDVGEELERQGEDTYTFDNRLRKARETLSGMGFETSMDGFETLSAEEQEHMLGNLERGLGNPARETVLGLSGVALRQRKTKYGRLR